MAESTNHVELLRRLIAFVQDTMNANHEMVVMHDLPASIGAEKPPTVGGFRPDLYATDAVRQLVVIGEAKTTFDIESDHSRAQYLAYAQHLRSCPEPILILSVPWHLRVRAKTLLRLATKAANAPHIVCRVIDDMEDL